MYSVVHLFYSVRVGIACVCVSESGYAKFVPPRNHELLGSQLLADICRQDYLRRVLDMGAAVDLQGWPS